MRKVNFFSVIKISTVVLSMVAGFTGATYGVNSVYAEDVEIREDIETTASSGNIIIGVEGFDYTSAQQDIIERINEIRYEACYAGNVPNPNKTSEYLKPSDYKPIQLGVSCTKAATIRSAEGAVRLAHVRPNSKSCNSVLTHFLGTSMVASAENLAWSNDHSSDLEQWYGEKKYWVDKNYDYETGHYTTLINPDYTYCGIATFNPDNDEIYTSSGWKADWCCTAGTFSSSDVAIAEKDYKDEQNKPIVQKMEITPSNVINITPVGNPLLHVGDDSNFELVVDVKCPGVANCTVNNCSVYDGVTWDSSDNTIVSINSSTGAVSAKKTGQVTITATMGSGSSLKTKEFDCVVVPAGVEPVEAVDPDMVTVESYKTPTLSNSVSVKLSDGTYIDVAPTWDSYDSKNLQTSFKSKEFDVTGKACGLDVVQKVHVNPAEILNVYCKEKKDDSYVVVTSKTTDSGVAVSYPSVGISLSNGYSWTYSATWTTRQKQNYKKREGGNFTEEGYATVSTDEGYKDLEVSFELKVNPASVTSVVYDEEEITTPSGTEPVYPVATVTWSNGDIDNADSPGTEYGYIIWEQTDDYKNAYKQRNGGTYEITGTYYDAINDVSCDKSTTVTVNVTPATVKSVVYNDDEIEVENGISPVSDLPEKANVTWSNGDNEDLDITWDSIPEENYKNLNKTETTFSVTGSVDCGNNITKEVSVDCKVKPVTIKEVESFDQIETLEEVSVDTKLPKNALVKWSNGLSSTEDIIWDEVDKDQLSTPDSTFDIKGSLKDIEGTDDAVSISVYVKPKTLESLKWYDEETEQAAETQTAKGTVFYDNYDWSKISGKLIAAYDNGTSVVFGMGSKQINVSDYDEDSKDSTQTVKLSYTYDNGKDEAVTKSVDMELTLHLPASLEITPSTKLEYIKGQELDTTGLSATTYYDDETVKKYAEGSVNYVISGYDKDIIGKQTISVTQDGMTKTFDVYVKQIAKVDFTGPAKTEYLEGQDFELTGTSAVITYNNETTDNANVAFNVDGGTLVADAFLYLDDVSVSEKKLKAGNYIFKITYKNYSSDEYLIEVKAPVKDGISQISEDSLDAFSDFDDTSRAEDIINALEGIVIKMPCADGSTTEVVLTKEMISEPETLKKEDAEDLSESEKKMVEGAAAENKVVKKIAIEISKDEEDNPVYTYVYITVDKKPEPTPTPTPTATPTATPTVEPTASSKPTDSPTTEPTVKSDVTPTAEVTATPVSEPSTTPTAEVTAKPTTVPTSSNVETTPTPTSNKPETTPTEKPTPTAEVTPSTEPETIEDDEVEAPSSPTVKSVKNTKGKKIKVSWKKVKGAKGYQVQYALNKSFTKSKKSGSTTKLTLTKKGFKKKKTYYVRVRAYTKDSSDNKVYGEWSKVKKVKIKK